MLHSLPRRIRHEQHVPASLGHSLQPRRGVGGVAERRVLDALLRADIACHDRAAVDAHPHAECVVMAMLGEPGVEPVKARSDHLRGRRQRAVGVIGLLERRSEHGHDAIAHVGDERTAGAQDRLGHLVQVAVDHLDHLRSRLRLGEARESAQIGEQHRAVALHGAEPQVVVGARDHLLDDVGGHEPREQVVHPLSLDRRDQVQNGERAERPEREREQRIDKGDDPTVIERDLRGHGEHDRRRQRAEKRAQGPQPQAAERRERPEKHDHEHAEPAGQRCAAARHATASRPRCPTPPAPTSSSAVGRGRRVNVLKDRR